MELEGDLKTALWKLSNHMFCGLTPLKLKVCDAGCGYGISFSDACARVDLITQTTPYGVKPKVYPFIDIFMHGNEIVRTLFDVLKTDDTGRLQTLVTFFQQIKEISKNLQVATEHSGKSETDWTARLAVHYFRALSLSQECIVGAHSRESPCSSDARISYGDTSVGNPQTWFGRFDILVGKNIRNKHCLEHDAHVGALVLDMESSDTSDLSDDEDSVEDLPQTDVLSGDKCHKYLSQIISQTIVFSFCQNKKSPFITFVPSIAVSKSHIQFHFYDSERDLYFITQKLPLFYMDKTLDKATALATWLVINHKELLMEPTKEMLEEKKFGFHSQVSNLELYKNEIRMPMSEFRPEGFDVARFTEVDFFAVPSIVDN